MTTATEQSLRLEWRDPATLPDHPENPRIHPARQSAATEELIYGETGVGWAGALLFNEATGYVLNGHDRKRTAAKHGDKVPVLVGSWTPEQERLILSTHDYVGTLARTDPKRMAGLLEGMKARQEELAPVLERLKTKPVAKLLNLEAPPRPHVPARKHVLSIVLDSRRKAAWDAWKQELGFSTDQRAMEALLDSRTGPEAA